MTKKLSKYILLIIFTRLSLFLSATSRGISIISFASVIRVPAGLASASFTLVFFFNYWNNKETVKSNKKEKEETQ